MSATTKPAPAPGQVWAYRDGDDVRYLTVLSVTPQYVHAQGVRKTRILADRFGRGSRWTLHADTERGDHG
ncbi:hypothetical protein ACFWYW_57465 [Nonomuraea sp. NPDC059023]|uniref:hypothetical protein n=1 Tax=unclassified Nonomuraea TaxID=2593643 RepID=UPI0036C260AD